MSATSLPKSPIIFSGTWRKITDNNLEIKKRKRGKTVEQIRILQVYVSVEKLADSSKKVWAGLGAPFLFRADKNIFCCSAMFAYIYQTI